MTRWEYFRRTNYELTDEQLAALGAEGWELVGVSYQFLLFKRPIVSLLDRQKEQCIR